MSRYSARQSPYYNPRQSRSNSGQYGAEHQQGGHGAAPLANQAQGRCGICSFAQPDPQQKVPVYHRHFSSLRLRMLTGAENNPSNPYLCPSCMSQHVPYPKNRIKLVISDSTLHEFFAPHGGAASRQYNGDTLHSDYLTIPGASTHTLSNAFRIDYLDTKPSKPLDVCIVAGYNDLVREYQREYILHKLQQLAAMVLEAKSGHGDNTVAIATFMYPPQIAWFPDNGPVPYPGYKNQKEKIDWLNLGIHQENFRNNARAYPGFHTYGVRTATRSYRDEYGQVHQRVTKTHRWEHWRESDPARMLHLRNDRRFKMGTAVNNYFIMNTNCESSSG